MKQDRQKSDGSKPAGPRVMEGGFDPAALTPRRWPGARVARTLMLLHVADDLAGLVAAYGLAYLVRFGLNLDPLRVLYGKQLAEGSPYAVRYGLGAMWYLLVFAAALMPLYALLGLYDGHMRLRRTPLMWNLILANGMTLVALATYLFFDKNSWHMRSFLPLVLMLDIPCAYAMRRLTNAVVKRMRNRNRLLYRTLLVGTGPEADKIAELSREHRLKGHRIVARIPAPKTPERAAEALAWQFKARSSVSTVFVIDTKLRGDVCVALLDSVRRANLAAVIYSPQFLRLHNPFEYGDTLSGVPLVHYAAPGSMFAPSRIRSAMSRAAAAAILLLAGPALLLVALAIRLESKGPALFVQERFGTGGKKFRMFKFRTMVADAEKRLAELKGENESDGALFKMHDDPRVTKLGKFLRRASIDELPQLINIARGEMRFVGPRPLPCGDLEPFLPYWQGFRQTVPPGLTCIWQCSGRSDIGFDSMSQLDIWYALNRSWLLDARIVARTFWSVIFGGGAY